MFDQVYCEEESCLYDDVVDDVIYCGVDCCRSCDCQVEDYVVDVVYECE